MSSTPVDRKGRNYLEQHLGSLVLEEQLDGMLGWTFCLDADREDGALLSLGLWGFRGIGKKLHGESRLLSLHHLCLLFSTI